MNIKIDNNYVDPEEQSFEIVERKGLGHPDTLVDGIVECAEINYAKYCLSNFGYIPHHNFDKAMLIGGLCKQCFGGADFQVPIKFVFMGRGSKQFGEQRIPIGEIQEKSTIDYLSKILPSLDVNNPKCFVFDSLTSDRSTKQYWFNPRGVIDLPEYCHGVRANDTATMISYYPLTLCEQLALDMEAFFYTGREGVSMRPKYKEFGQDIKVMVIRKNDSISVTICVPQITYETPTVEVYNEREIDLYNKVVEYVRKLYPNKNISITLNSGNKDKHKYLVTGGSCTDFGEEGAVGRGNKTRGIISSFRANTMEAPHGKNPTYFVGKVLGYVADILAKKIYEASGAACQVILQANLGDDLFAPSNIIISTKTTIDEKLIENIVYNVLSAKNKITLDIINSGHYIPNVSY